MPPPPLSQPPIDDSRWPLADILSARSLLASALLASVGLTGCGLFHPDSAAGLDDTGPGDTADSTDSTDSTGEGGFCARSLADDAPADECVTADIACGESVTATLSGGRSDWVGTDYTTAFCFTNFDENDYAGPERIYALSLPENGSATITLETPCADLDLAAIRWERDTCPDDSDPLTQCEGSDETGNDSVSFSWDSASRWLIVVDAKNTADSDANFRLSVACE